MDDLVHKYLHLPKKIVRSQRNKYPYRYSTDDMEGYANLGLVDAARSYNSSISKNVKFDKYASFKIRFAIQDGFVEMSEFKRTAYRSGASDFNMIVEFDTLADKFHGTVDGDVEAKDQLEYIQGIINQLEDRKQQVIRMRYFLNMTQKEISKMLGLTEAKVGILQRAAFKDMKRILNREGMNGSNS